MFTFFFRGGRQNNPVVGPWATTQNLSLEAQLKAGVRVLDFRCGYVGLDAQNYDHVADGVAIVHDKYRTSISLRQALVSVKQFVQEHPRYLSIYLLTIYLPLYLYGSLCVFVSNVDKRRRL